MIPSGIKPHFTLIQERVDLIANFETKTELIDREKKIRCFAA